MLDYFKKLLYGRYGIDKLTTSILIISVVLSLLYNITHFFPLYLISSLILLFGVYRMFSKNFAKRQHENYLWCNFLEKLKKPTSKITRRIKDFPKYKYYKCMNCGQTIRIPRGKGRVEIRCPKCGYSFRSKT